LSRSFIVTGGAGFIGCNVAAALNKRGCENIVIVDRLNHEAKEGNISALRYREFRDKADFRRDLLAGRVAPVDTVFHLGACSSTTESDADYLMDNNVAYTRDLCNWCLEHGTRFVYASSAATYGDGSQGYSDDEQFLRQLAPLNLYGQSKQDFDLWALDNGLLDRIAGLKYFNVYGPHEDHKGDMRSVVNKAYTQICGTGELALFRSRRPDYEDGKQDRDFVYVKDAVAVTLFFHDHPEVSGLFNCGTGRARTWYDLALAIFAAMGREPRIRFIDMPESIRDKYQYHTEADMTRLRAAGYTAPFTSIEDGVREYVREYLSARS